MDMQRIKRRIFLFLIIFVCFSPVLNAEDKRVIPLDMYLIIDGSSSFESSKEDAVAWLNGYLIDRILMEGDKVTIWTAGDKAELVYSGEVSDSGGAPEIKQSLAAIETGGQTADFTGALRELEPLVSRTPENRLSYTVLVTASAGGLSPSSSQGLLKWSRSEKYERWQALVVAPGIGRRANQAATAYMNSIR